MCLKVYRIDLERWETKLLTASKPMVTEMEVEKGELKLFTLITTIQVFLT